MVTEITAGCTIYEVEKLKAVLLEALKSGEALTLDMQKTQKIDMVGIQLLLSFVKTAYQKGQKVEFVNISEGIRHQIKGCHCEAALGIINA